MIGILLRMALVALGLYITTTIVPGVIIDNVRTLVLAALVLAVVNAVVRPIVVGLTSFIGNAFIGRHGRVERYQRQQD